MTTPDTLRSVGEIPATLLRASQRRRVYDFIIAEINATRPFPTKRQIRDHMGWVHDTSAYDALQWLCCFDKVLDRDLITGEWRLVP